jgi:hypothetical protein
MPTLEEDFQRVRGRGERHGIGLDLRRLSELIGRQPGCYESESTAYEGDEAAILAKITRRIAEYPGGFLVMKLDGRVAGFINSGYAWQVVMSDEAFKELFGHDPAAPNVVIMSVAIDAAFHGRGHASTMMRTSWAGCARPPRRPST